MSWINTADINSIRLEDNHILVANLETADKNWNESSIDLNKFIGNEDGYFVWDGENFSETCYNIRLEGSILYADLSNREGNYCQNSIDLAERIENQDGNFAFI